MYTRSFKFLLEDYTTINFGEIYYKTKKSYHFLYLLILNEISGILIAII